MDVCKHIIDVCTAGAPRYKKSVFMQPGEGGEKMAERTESADRYIDCVSGSVGQHFALHFKAAAFAKNL